MSAKQTLGALLAWAGCVAAGIAFAIVVVLVGRSLG